MRRLSYVWLPATLLMGGVLHAQSLELQIELMNPIGTDTSRKGDLVSGRVLSPAHLQGDMVEGKVNESRSGAKLGGQSVFSFSFDTLRHGGATIAISSQFKSASNSKGRANVDEEGRIVKRATGNVGKAAGGTGLGGLIGAAAGGKRGAAIGAAAGAVTSIVLIEVAADAPNIRFAPGSRVVIEATARGGQSLAMLPRAPANEAPPMAAPVAAPASETTSAPAAYPVYQPAPAAQSASQSQAAAPAPQPLAPAAGGPAQPEFTTLKATFVPGEKTIFYDDFTDMTADDPPPHFKVRGAAMELRGSGNLRQLTAVARGSIFPNLTALPKNFTWEAELKADKVVRAITTMNLMNKNRQILQMSMSVQQGQFDAVASLRAPYSELGRKRIAVNSNEPIKVALWLQDGRMRFFVNGEKHLDFNQVTIPDIDQVEFAHDFYGAGQSLGYRSMRFAESTPDFSQVIMASGRYVSHGIQFDTDSDRLKPESAPAIQSIAKALETNANLKLLIEGHTDSTGDAAHNLDLSRRRAEAVKAVLTAQFKVDAARLTTAGIGAAKPIDSNDTPAGRAQNRRVEFVKQ